MLNSWNSRRITNPMPSELPNNSTRVAIFHATENPYRMAAKR